MEEEVDRISCLPDCLLIEIMSRLKTKLKSDENKERTMTTKEVIRTTATISKRWKHLWTLLPNLIFVDEYDIPNTDLDYLLFIDKTLTSRRPAPFVKLNEFRLHFSFDSGLIPDFKSRAVSWIRHAITQRYVQKVRLRLFDTARVPHEFSFDDDLFFDNTCFTDMELRECLLSPPKGVIRWENLESLHLGKARLDEVVIENIFSGTPCLRGLVFQQCHGYRLVDITSKSLMSFTFRDYNLYEEYYYLHGDNNYIDCIEINAPHLSELTIKGEMCLKNLLLLDVSSLVEADLDYSNARYFATELEEETMLEGLLQSLSHVDGISFGDSCLKVYSRFETQWLEGQLGSTQQENASLQEQLGSEIDKNAQLQDKITRLEDENTKLNTKLGSEIDKNAQLQEKIARLEDENTKLKVEIQANMQEAKDHAQLLNSKLDDCKCEMTQMAVVNRLKEDVWNVDVGKLKMQLVTKDDAIKELATRLDSQKADVCSVVEDVEKVNNELMLKMAELKGKVIGSDKLF